MAEHRRGSFWGTVAIAGIAYPYIALLAFNLLLFSARGIFYGWSSAMWGSFVLALPFIALTLVLAVTPIGLVYGAICAVLSRKTPTRSLWILRGMVVGGLCALLSYAPLALYFRSNWSWERAVLIVVLCGLTAGGLSSLLMERYRPRAEGQVGSETVFEEASSEPAGPRRGALVGVVGHFALIGTLVWFIAFLVWKVPEAKNPYVDLHGFTGDVIMMIAVAVALSPLAVAQASLTGLFCGILSRKVPSTRRWLSYCTLMGAAVWIVSLMYPLIFALDLQRYGIGGALMGAALGLGLTGVASAFVAALACRKSRPIPLSTKPEASRVVSVAS